MCHPLCRPEQGRSSPSGSDSEMIWVSGSSSCFCTHSALSASKLLQSDHGPLRQPRSGVLQLHVVKPQYAIDPPVHLEISLCLNKSTTSFNASAGWTKIIDPLCACAGLQGRLPGLVGNVVYICTMCHKVLGPLTY